MGVIFSSSGPGPGQVRLRPGRSESGLSPAKRMVGTTRNTSPNLMLRAQKSKVIPSLFELDTNASQACSQASCNTAAKEMSLSIWFCQINWWLKKIYIDRCRDCDSLGQSALHINIYLAKDMKPKQSWILEPPFCLKSDDHEKDLFIFKTSIIHRDWDWNALDRRWMLNIWMSWWMQWCDL